LGFLAQKTLSVFRNKRPEQMAFCQLSLAWQAPAQLSPIRRIAEGSVSSLVEFLDKFRMATH
jgi:hypothetical protein